MESSIFFSFVKMLFALALVLGLMVGAAYLFRRVLPRNAGPLGNPAVIRVVAAHYLGPRSSILLVEVLGEAIVVGVSPGQMSTLATIRDGEALKRLEDLRVQENRPPSVMDLLKKSKVIDGAIRKYGRHR
jgi:flagellar protein FliO/FliZ